MVTTEPAKNIYTLINVFHVAPEKQQALADMLRKATETTIKHQPGFVSANIHRSFDGRRVFNCAQWRSKEDFETGLHNPEVRLHYGKGERDCRQ